MNEKLTFTPCKVEKIGFDEQLDIIRTSDSNAKEGFSWWSDGKINWWDEE